MKNILVAVAVITLWLSRLSRARLKLAAKNGARA